ncbi:putative Zn-dependent hydrolase of beta-lactamase fold protein [Belliella baltica DSM 15883]|uniref:Putative Zn-dependent hydrolase of beta-lactamase fold protein n=1 Tax=Belliella baltica (strain DSM 15883 / CIP 108006 / LMG 21964 / BA134) TaxID=866536 RepID=I3Z9V7_BELBD|nr:MBL fold metallo-hydrolase [Belliella baltica]AFL86025.1 putative Zn-dependent hydrolase of beta-lactamase fold protein [Belliella baltica DSM 15883]
MKPKYLFALLVPAIMIYMIVKPVEQIEMNFTSNSSLKTTAPSPNWKGTPIDSKGRFSNLYHPFEASLKDVLKWKLSTNPQNEEKKNDTRSLPISSQTFDFQTKEDYIIWLGHASYLMQLNGITFVTDPILMDNFFLKRKSKLPFLLENFPKIDYLLLSHNHRDHCDESTIEWLIEQNPQIEILTGLGMKSVISSWIDDQEVQEAGWYQSYNLPIESLEIHFVPSRHWSKRWLNDDNKSLWGGFYLKSNEKSIYFMSDSGQGQHFEDIKNTLGSPEYSIMGIGAYKPEWFMYQSHISPLNAIDAFNSMGGKYFIPMHYGTFDLSDEPILEPWDVLSANQNKIKGQLVEPILGLNLLQE